MYLDCQVNTPCYRIFFFLYALKIVKHIALQTDKNLFGAPCT